MNNLPVHKYSQERNYASIPFRVTKLYSPQFKNRTKALSISGSNSLTRENSPDSNNKQGVLRVHRRQENMESSVVEPKLFVSAPAQTFKKFRLRLQLRLRH
jgi:hypothetical protein